MNFLAGKTDNDLRVRERFLCLDTPLEPPDGVRYPFYPRDRKALRQLFGRFLWPQSKAWVPLEVKSDGLLVIRLLQT